MMRSLIPASLAVLLVFSLVSSAAIRYGHADVPVAETAKDVQPLTVGESAPRFFVETVDGTAYEFDPQHLDAPTILISFRGGWCPYCNMHLSELRHVIPEIAALGVDVLFLSGDRPELLYSSLKRETQDNIDGLGYTILSDADAQAAMALGIAFKAPDRTIRGRLKKGQDIEGSSMLRHGILPVPSVFAIDKRGTITFAYVNPNYKIRLAPDKLLAAARAIAAD